MKQSSQQQQTNQRSAARRGRIAGMVLLAGIAVASLSGGAWADAAAAPAAPGGAATPGRPAGVEGLIGHLHQELKITPAQESLFLKVADVMREDAATMSTLAKKRADGAATMTAVDDLKSYAEISEAHAQGTKRMIPVFQELYSSMSEAQKKLADVEFRDHYATHHRRKR